MSEQQQTLDSITAQVELWVAEQIGLERPLSTEASLERLGVDSLDTVELLMTAEEELGCSIEDPEDEFTELLQKPYTALAKYIHDQLTKASQG